MDTAGPSRRRAADEDGRDTEAIHDWSRRAKSQRVKGQRGEGHGRDDIEIDEEARDATVQRPVEVVIVASEDIDAQAAAKRALWRRDQAAGEGLKVSVPHCIGWRDGAGRLWEPGYTVWVESPYLGVAQEMAIDKVEGQQTDAGTDAALSLVDPRALGAKGGKGKGKRKKSKKQWDMPE